MATLLCSGGVMSSATAFAQGKSVKIEASETDDLVASWMAAGSGCLANSQKKGDVTLVSAKNSPENPSVYNIIFKLPKYELKPFDKKEKGRSGSKMNYARECSLRVNVNPPKGMRLSDVSAATGFEMSKERGAKLLVNASLKLGAVTLVNQTKQFKAEEDFRFRSQKIDLVTGGDSGQGMPPTDCDENKLVGVDLTALTNKKMPENVVTSKITSGGLLTVKVALTSCKS